MVGGIASHPHTTRIVWAVALAVSIATCGAQGERTLEAGAMEFFQRAKCFGLDRNISYVAERSSQSGDDIWLGPRFTFANSFDFVPATRDAGQIAYANAVFDPISRKLTIKFFLSNGHLAQESSLASVEIRKCTENQTEIYFPRPLTGDGGRVDDRITVNVSRLNGSALVTTKTDRTAYILLVFPMKRFRTYVAEFRLHNF